MGACDKDYANTRYSTLDPINTTNVATLKVAWTFQFAFAGVASAAEPAGSLLGTFNLVIFLVSTIPNEWYRRRARKGDLRASSGLCTLNTSSREPQCMK